MSENAKRMLSFLVAVCLVVSMVPVSVSAQEQTIEQTEPAVTEPAPLPVVETVPETIPETVPETIPETVPETVLETIPETVPETIPETVPETAPVVVPETEYQSESNLIPLELDVPVSVTTRWEDEESYAYAYLSFTPEESGLYQFTSISEIDTYGELFAVYPEGTSFITYNDDSGDGNNFLISLQLTAGESYQLRVRRYSGDECSFLVKVERVPSIESISFTPVTVVKNTYGYIQNPEMDDETEDDYYYYEPWSILAKSTYTAMLSNGQEKIGSFFDLREQYSTSYSTNQSAENPWTVGNTYYIDVTVMGLAVQVLVTITELPLERLSFQTVTVMEQTYGDFVMENGTEYFRYSESALLNKSAFTVSFAGGEEIYGSGNRFYYDGAWYYLDGTSNQSAENPWVAGNTYYMDATVRGYDVQAQLPVTVSKPINLELDAPQEVTISDGESVYCWFTPTESGLYNFSSISSVDTYAELYEVTQGGGTRYLTGNDDSGNGMNFLITRQLEAGKTYQLQVRKYTSGTRSFQVLVERTPSIESISFTPVSVIANTNGYMEEAWIDGEYVGDYYYYELSSLLNKSTYKATLSNGNVIQGSAGNLSNQYDASYSMDQSYENQWTAGNTYYIEVSVMDQRVQIPVTITPSPIQSLTFTPVSVVENTNGYFNGDYYRYNLLDLLYKSTYTATYTDGTVRSGSSSGISYDDWWHSFSYSDNQSYENQWTAGNTYYVEITVLGASAQLAVTIKETPVASVTFDPVTISDARDGNWVWDDGTEYYKYYWAEMLNYSVTFKDGTVKHGSYDNPVVYDGDEFPVSNCSDNQSSFNPWLVGNTYSATVKFMGKEYEVFVSVEKSTEDNGFEYILQDGKAIITFCTTSGEIIAIPETIDGYPVVGVASLGEAVNYALEVRIPDCVTMLSSDVFYGNYSGIPLKKLTLGKGVPVIPRSLGYFARNLEEIEVSEENPYFCSIEGVVYDKALTTLIFYPSMKMDMHIIPDSVTNVDVIFSGDEFAEWHTNVNVQFGDGITNYKMVDGVVYNANMTRVIRATDAATGSYTMPETVTVINSFAFHNSKLAEIAISPNVTSIVYTVFSNCINLKELTIPKSVKNLSISGCENLEKVHISDLAAWCGTEIGDNPLQCGADLYLNGEKIVDLVIPDTVTYIRDLVFCGGSFASVTIPASVEAIGIMAFAECENLKKVYITDLAAWCDVEFYGADANPLTLAKDLYLNGERITNLVIPEGVRSIGEYAFFNGSMTSATVPATVYGIGYEAFYNASVESIALPEGLQSIGESAFERSALKSVALPDSLTGMGYSAFSECTALQSVDFGSGIEYIADHAFYATGLECVTIPRQVTEINAGAFAYSKLKNVQFDCEAVSIWGGAFNSCPLGDLEFGDNVKEISDGTFANVEATQIKLPPSITQISYRTFAFNKNLVSVTIPASVEYIYSTAFQGDSNLSHVLYTGTQNQWDALEVESPELNRAVLHCEATGNEVTTEQTCTTIRFFCTICDKWESVKKAHANHTFVNDVCSVCGQEGYWEYVVNEDAGDVTITGYLGNEYDVVLPDELEGLPVTAFTADTFNYNTKLTSIEIPGTIKEIPSEAFYGCKSLTSVSVESGVTAIGSYAFFECEYLRNVELPNTVTVIGEYAFSDCDFEKIQLPENLTTIGEAAFISCGNLKEVTIPASVTEICYFAFSGCYNLEKVIVSEGVTKIAYYAFRGCWDLEELQLPDTLISIGNYAFNCHRLTTLEIPANVEHIGEGAFWAGENELKTVAFRGPAPIMGDAFEGSFTAFYDPAQPGWDEYLANYEGRIDWRPVTEGPVIRVQPQSVTVESGSTATVSTEGYGYRLRYQWYCAPEGSDTFVAVGGNSFELSMIMNAENPQVRAYCIITDVLGKTATTETVTLKIKTYTYTVTGGKATITAYAGEGGNVIIPAELDGYPVVAIGEGAFSGNSSLRAVTIPEGVTSVGNKAFENCANLTTVTIPKSITVIGDAAFMGTAVTDVYYAGSQSKWKTISIGGDNEMLTNATMNYSHTHDYTLLPPVIVQPTCAEEGYVEYTCVYGDSYRVILPKVDHESVPETTVAPTCEEQGYTISKCIHCGATSQGDFKEALGHDYIGSEIITAPTCEQGGYTDLTCNRCGKTERTDYQDALGHDYSGEVKTLVEPTCTEDGVSGHGCIRCDAVREDGVIDALGHSMAVVPAKAATCTEAGTTIGTQCSRCQMFGVCPKPTAPLGHDYRGEHFNGKPGYTKYTCSRCDDAYTVEDNIIINTQPADQNKKLGEIAIFAVEATGAVSYQWQRMKAGATAWTNISGATGASYAVKVSASAIIPYRCVLTDAEGNKLITDEVTIILPEPLVHITNTAGNRHVIKNSSISFTVKLDNTAGVTYQWQRCKSGNNWTNVSYSGNQTKTVTFTATSWAQYPFRCEITDANGTKIYTETYTYTLVEPPVAPNITSNPKDVYLVSGNTATFSVEAVGSDLTYQWWRSKNGGATWGEYTGTGNKTASISLKVYSGQEFLYMCEVKDGYGNTLKTKVVQPRLIAAVKITAQPKVTVSSGTATITFTATGDVKTYQWQRLKNGTWSDAVGANYVGYNAATLKTTVKGTWRCRIVDLAGNITYTNEVTFAG